MKPSYVGSISWTHSDGKEVDGGVRFPAVKGSYRNTMVEGEQICWGTWGTSNAWECLNVWRSPMSPHCAWGCEHCADDTLHSLADEHAGHEDLMCAVLQGVQPYTNVGEHHANPFPSDTVHGNFGIDIGVDHDFSILFRPREGMSHACAAPDDEHVSSGGDPKLSPVLTECSWEDEQGDGTVTHDEMGRQEVIGALPLTSTEQLGQPRLATSGTLIHLLQPSEKRDMSRHSHVQCAFLGGGKLDNDDYFILEDEEKLNVDLTTPGLLQDRLLVLQEKALAAIQALPAKCRDDHDYGLVETRVWGLEALKHILRMRLALQGCIQLTRPVTQSLNMPPSNELLAANLTLTFQNKGNRCFANSVLRMWCWMGAHHEKPGEFWGPSTNLCLQLLQQDDIPDVFWASELQPVSMHSMTPRSFLRTSGSCGVNLDSKGRGTHILVAEIMNLRPCRCLSGCQLKLAMV